jgi:hypothetical protein
MSDSPVILAVDTSHIAVGFHLCQCNPDDPKKCHYARFRSIMLNEHKAQFSQPKLELYELYRALGTLRLYLIGVRNLIVEVDTRYIKGMLANPDIVPSASINRCIMAILTFHFDLVHVPGTRHGPDRLSQRLRQPNNEDPSDPEDFEDWIDNLHGFLHQINVPTSSISTLRTMQSVYTITTAQVKMNEEEDGHKDHDQHNAQPELVKKWHDNLKQPSDLNDEQYTRFLCYCTHFFISDDCLWCKDPNGTHKLVIDYPKRYEIMKNAHDDLGHKGLYATQATITERFWWPTIRNDIAQFIKTCQLCQVCQTRQVLIPPFIATPGPLFAKIYIDTMHMPCSNGYSYIIQG